MATQITRIPGMLDMVELYMLHYEGLQGLGEWTGLALPRVVFLLKHLIPDNWV